MSHLRRGHQLLAGDTEEYDSPEVLDAITVRMFVWMGPPLELRGREAAS